MAHSCDQGVAVSSGTAALHLILAALEIPRGDEVLIPAYGCPAVDAAVLTAGLTPVHVDIDPRSGCISPVAVASAVRPRTAAVIAVHFAGAPADLPSLDRICSRRGLALVEDACLAPGATWKGRSVGSWGVATAFSMGWRKPISVGEGGVIVTRDAILASRMRRLRCCGQDPDSGELRTASLNFRLSGWLAALALPQLRERDVHRLQRGARATDLSRRLAELPSVEPLHVPDRWDGHAWGQYWLLIDGDSCPSSAEAFAQLCQAAGAPVVRGWSTPNRLHPVYARDRANTWLKERDASLPPDWYETHETSVADDFAFHRACLLGSDVLRSSRERVSRIGDAIRQSL